MSRVSRQPRHVLVVGAGYWGSHRAAAVVRSRSARLLGVVDPDLSRAEELADWFGVPAHADLEEAMHRTDGLDGVIIATPHDLHADQVRCALESGHHVLSEKPLALDPEEAQDLARLADSRQVALATGLNHRFYEPIADLLGHVERGELGRVRSVVLTIGHCDWDAFLNGWRATPHRAGGGTLADNGPHGLDLIRQCLTEVVAVQASGSRDYDDPNGGESEAAALLIGRDGGIGVLQSSWNRRQGYLDLEVRGTRGQLRAGLTPWSLDGSIDGGRPIHRRYLTARLGDRLDQMLHGCGSTLVREIESWCRPYRANDPRRHANGWDGARVTELLAACYEAMRTGRTVDVEPLPTRAPSQPISQFVLSGEHELDS